jgi:hypothetical protein
MARAWQETAPPERVVDPRPGALLSAAAAVPLGIAVLLAAGLLPAGPRVVVGLALAVLGVRLVAEAGTELGARIGVPTARGAGLASIVCGAVLAAGGVTVVLFDQLGGTSVADGLRSEGTLAGGPASGVAALVLLAGGALAGLRLDRDAGRFVRPRSAGDAAARDRSVGTLVAAVGAAVALPPVLGDGVLGLGDGARVVILLVVAALATAEGLRRTADDDVGRGLLVAAGVLVVLTGGEATQLLTSAVGPLADPNLGGLDDSGARGARVAVAAALSVVLLVGAVHRRDAVVGVLPLGVLLLVLTVDGTGEKVGALLVPALVAVAAAAALGGAGPLRERVGREALWAGLGAALLIVLAQAGSVLPGERDAGTDVEVVTLIAGIAGLAVLVVVAALARVVAGRAGAALGVVALLAVVAVSPLAAIQRAGPDSWPTSVPVSLVVWLLSLVVVGADVHRRREPLVIAAAALLVAAATTQFTFVLILRDGLDELDLSTALVVQLGPPVVVLVGAALVALLGPAALVTRAQAAGAGAAYAAGISAVGAAQVAQQFGFGAADEQLLDGGALVVVVLLLLLLAVGAAILAASTARRPSAGVAVAVVGATVASAVLAAAVGFAADEPSGSEDSVDIGQRSAPSAADLALGLRTVAGAVRDVGAGWPILFGVLGAVLLGAAWFLESRRPVPPGVTPG